MNVCIFFQCNIFAESDDSDDMSMDEIIRQARHVAPDDEEINILASPLSGRKVVKTGRSRSSNIILLFGSFGVH